MLISINFTSKSSHSCQKKCYIPMFSRAGVLFSFLNCPQILGPDLFFPAQVSTAQLYATTNRPGNVRLPVIETMQNQAVEM